MSALPPILVELKANAGEFMTKMGEARHEVSKLGTESAGHVQKFAAVGKAALLGFAGAAIGVGTLAVHAALEGEAAHANLVQAVKNTGGSMQALEPQVSALSSHMAKLGFANNEVEAGLATMTTSLGDPSKAMGAMGLAADLARTKGIDLSTASIAVAKAMEGQLRPLKQLGIDLPVASAGAQKLAQAHDQLTSATTKLATFLKIHKDAVNANSKQHGVYLQMLDKVHAAETKLNATQNASKDITAALSHAIGGQAAAAADTYAGKLAATRAQVENLAEKLGNVLLPIIAAVISKTTDIVGWFEKHKTTAEVLAAVVGGVLVAAITAYVVELTIAAVESVVAFGGMLVAGAAAAAGLVIAFAPFIIAIAAVGIAAYELYRHWSTIWGGIKAVANDVWSFLRSYGVWIVAAFLGPVAVAALELYQHWSTVWGAIKTVTTSVGHAIAGAFGDIIGAGRDLVAWIVDKLLGAFGMIVDGAASAFGWVPGIGGKLKGAAAAFDTFRDNVNYALDGIHKNVMINVDAHVSAAANKALHASAPLTIGHAYAKGTDYAAGGLSLVGENGPEVVNMPRGSKVYPHGTGPGGGTVVNVNIDTAYGDPDAFAGAIRDALLRMQSRGTKLGFAV